jgi:transposase InsO family protein
MSNKLWSAVAILLSIPLTSCGPVGGGSNPGPNRQSPFESRRNSLTTDFCIDAVEEAIAKFGSPDIFNTDQGSQFTRAPRRPSTSSGGTSTSTISYDRIRLSTAGRRTRHISIRRPQRRRNRDGHHITGADFVSE